MGSLERYAKRETEAWTIAILKFSVGLLVFFWPLGLIDGAAFAPRPGVLGWVVGGVVEVLWLVGLFTVYILYQQRRARRPQLRTARRR